MRIQSGQLVALGYGTYVHSDEVVAVTRYAFPEMTPLVPVVAGIALLIAA